MKVNKKMQLLSCIDDYTRENGYPPTIRELCALLGYRSTSSVHAYIRQLQEDGLLSYEASKPRTLTVAR